MHVVHYLVLSLMTWAAPAISLMATPAAGSASSPSTSWLSDYDGVVEALSKSSLSLPSEASSLRVEGDGLPRPDYIDFGKQASRFLDKNPMPAPGTEFPESWTSQRLASRQVKCLEYLASGQKPHRRAVASLCVAQARLMQWVLPVWTGKGRSRVLSYSHVAGPLAFTGAAAWSHAEERSTAREIAALWVRIGVGQITSYGDKARGSERKAADAMIAAITVDRSVLDPCCPPESLLAQIDLGHPGLSAVAPRLAVGDREGATAAYLSALAERFSRPDWPELETDKEVDLGEADGICRNVFLLQAHMYRRYDFGDAVDWAKVIDDDIESRVWMNSHPWMNTLCRAYRQTGDEKYVEHLCRLFRSWYQSSPPTFERSNAQWRSLEVGKRPAMKWPPVLLKLAKHPRFRRECLLEMACSMLDHANYLALYNSGGGNWAQLEASGLACVALLFPEFRLSPVFYEMGINRLTAINARTFLPDGFQSECSTAYHCLPLSAMGVALRLAALLHAPGTEELMRQYERGIEVLQYIAYPTLNLPGLSDVGPQPTNVLVFFTAGAEVFGRPDFRWFSSGGQAGHPPRSASHDFTHAGYCVMRDKWGPDSQVLVFDAGYFGSGHQHEDKLNFVLFAGGRELIGDPGIYAYKHDAFEPYWRGSWGHNTVTIDELSQHRLLGPTESIPDPDRRFLTSEEFDFASGWYRGPYSTKSADVRGDAAGHPGVLRNVSHQRCIAFLKGRYAIVMDRIVGSGEHQLDIQFHLSPIMSGGGPGRQIRPVHLETTGAGAVITRETDHANVAVVPASGKPMQILDLIGQRDPVRGWFALYGIQPSHDVIFRARRALPAQFGFVIQPLSPGVHEPPRVEPRPVSCDAGVSAAALSYGQDLFLLSYDGPTRIVSGEVSFQGTALLLTRDSDKQDLHAHMVDGTELRVGDEQVFAAATPVPVKSASLPGRLEVR